MGIARNRKKTFLTQHPFCAFCGGKTPSTTIEHCPPRSLFQNKVWPEGFEFPACNDCNQNSSDDDLIIAALCRLTSDDQHAKDDGRGEGLLKMVNQQFPQLIAKMLPTASEARRMNRELGIVPSFGQTHQDVSPIKIPDEINNAVRVFASKLTKAVFYNNANQVFPNEGLIVLNWFTNEALVHNGKFPMFELLKTINGSIPEVKRSGELLTGQFEYKISLSADKKLVVLQAVFGKVFGLVTLGSTSKSQLEGIFKRMREKGASPDQWQPLSPSTLFS